MLASLTAAATLTWCLILFDSCLCKPESFIPDGGPRTLISYTTISSLSISCLSGSAIMARMLVLVAVRNGYVRRLEPKGLLIIIVKHIHL